MFGPGIFVARESELAQLDQKLGAMLQGQGQLCLVSGEAGAGKTALLMEFCSRAQQKHSNLIVTLGACDSQTGGENSYLPFREALHQLTGEVHPQRPTATLSKENENRLEKAIVFSMEALVEFGPDLVGSLMPGSAIVMRLGKFLVDQTSWQAGVKKLLDRKAKGDKTAAVPEVPQDQIFEQTINFLRSFSQKAPLILILDDLHWADRASLDLLLRLGRRLQESRILILGTYRPDEVALGRAGERHPLEKVIAELKRSLGEIELDLNRTVQRESEAFVDALLDSSPNCLNDHFRGDLLRHTQGQPLFTMELLRDLQERGELVKVDGCWITSKPIDWSRLPARVEGVIEERIGRLSREMRNILSVASVEGEQFTAEIIAQISKVEARDLVRLMSGELQKHHQLVESLGLAQIERKRISRYRFSHSLIQFYLYEALDEAERAYLHEDLGLALEAFYGEAAHEMAVQLAYHFECAHSMEKARDYLQLAGDQARLSYANDAAVSYYSRALALTPQEDVEKRFELLILRENSFSLIGDRASQRQDLDALVLLAAELQEAQKSARAAIRQAKYFFQVSDYRQAAYTAEKAIPWLEACPRDGTCRKLLVEAYHVLGQADSRQGLHEEALHRLEQALELSRLNDDAQGEVLALQGLGELAWSQGKGTAARQSIQDALRFAQRLDDRQRTRSLLNQLGIIEKEMQDYPAAQAAYEQALRIAREIGDRWGESKVLNNLGEVWSLLGDEAKARDYCLQALDIARLVGDRSGEGLVRVNLGEAATAVGAFAEAETHNREALAIFQETGYRMGEEIALGNLAQLACKQEDPGEALRLAEQALQIAGEVGDEVGKATLQKILGEAWLLMGDFKAARNAFAQSAQLWAEQETMSGVLEARAGGMIALSQAGGGEGRDAAARLAYELLENLERQPVADPLPILLRCWYALDAVGNARAVEALEKAHAALIEHSEHISDPAARQSFLNQVPLHLEIQRQYEMRHSKEK